MKKIWSILILANTFGGIGLIFWYSEWRYSLPTPIPANYQAVSIGSKIDISNKFHFTNTAPTFLHFFNPDCPCSRFNISYFKKLVAEYGTRINFAVVVITKDQSNTASFIINKY